MTNQDINKYIKIYKEFGDEEAFKKLMKQYRNMIYGIISKYKKDNINGKEDLYQNCMISMIKALNAFDVNRGIKFSTYLHQIINNDLNRLYAECNRQKRKAIVNSIDEIIPSDEKRQTMKDTLKDDTVDIEYQVVDNDSILVQEILDEYRKQGGKYIKKGDIVEMILKDIRYQDIADKYNYKSKSRIDAIFKEFCIYAKEKVLEMNN